MKKRMKKRKKRRLSAKEKLKRKLKRNHPNKNMTIVDSPEGVAKMSDMIEVILGSYIDEPESTNAFTNLIGLAVMAWNTTLLPADKQDESLDHLKNLFPQAEDLEMAKEMVAILMKRKLEIFPEVNRIIVDFSVVPDGDGWDIEIASTLPPDF